MRFRERHQDPDATDIEYAARINDFDDVDEFIDAHSGSPWFVSMVGFVAGPAVPVPDGRPRERQIEVPKYLRPRTDTPKLTVGHGGCFGCIYSVRGAGGYQMFGITPMPIYDPKQELPDFKDFMLLLPAGRHREVRADRPRALRRAARGGRAGRDRDPPQAHVTFDLEEFTRDIDGYNAQAAGGAPCRLRSSSPGSPRRSRTSAGRATTTSASRCPAAWTSSRSRAANLLVGNEPGRRRARGASMGPELRFTEDALVAVTGAEMTPKVERRGAAAAGRRSR